MQRSRFGRLSAVLAVVALLLAACGTNEEEQPAGQGGGGGGASQPAKTVKLGVIAPLVAGDSALGIGIRNAVDLAIKQANEKNKIEGWKIELAAETDDSKTDIGGQAAAKLASDDAVAGVVGTLNTSVALQVQPILADKNIVMVSPANTGVELTQGTDPRNKKRQYPNYFRVATTDAIQGPFAANYASRDLNAKNVVTIHNKLAYGVGLVTEFTNQLTKNGGKVVAAESYEKGDIRALGSILTKVKDLNPDVIYYGGEYEDAASLSVQAESAGIKAPIFGGDGINSAKFIEAGKQAVEGDLCTSIGAPTEELESASQFIDDYKAAGYKEPYEAYGGYAFDAANVIIEAFAKVLPGKLAITPEVRQQIVTEVGKTNYDGVTGKVGFDEFGDTTTKVLTVYKVTNGQWKPTKTEEFK